MQVVEVDFELSFCEGDVLHTELILESDQNVLQLDPPPPAFCLPS
jgi:hypothetical protein